MDPITLILLLAGVAATIGGTVTSAAVNRQNQVDTNNMQCDLTRETNAQNVELAQLQHQWDIDMWNMQNAYNAPAAQMQRFRQAGLNPSLMYGSGTGIMNEAAPAAAAPNMAGMLKTPIMHSLMQNLDFGGSQLSQNALVNSQARLADAQARNLDAQTEYQQYLNAVEEQLQKIPVGEFRTISDNGDVSYEVVYGNARVEISKRQLRALGLSTEGLQLQLSDLFYDLAVKTGSDLRDFSSPSQLPNYSSAVAALRGDQNTQKVAGQLADIGRQAAEAEKAGRQAYARWLEEHKDDPVVKFALTLQGFFQTLGISLPHVGGSSSDYFRGSRGTASASSSSWYFGN